MKPRPQVSLTEEAYELIWGEFSKTKEPKIDIASRIIINHYRKQTNKK